MVIAVVGLVALALVQALLIFELRKERKLLGRIEEMREKQWDRERGQLLDRIMYLAGQPWSAPPIDFPGDVPLEADVEPEPDALDVPIGGDLLYVIGDEGPPEPQLSGRV